MLPRSRSVADKTKNNATADIAVYHAIRVHGPIYWAMILVDAMLYINVSVLDEQTMNQYVCYCGLNC